MNRIPDTRMASWFSQVADGLDSGLNAANAVALAGELPENASKVLAQNLESGKTWATSFEEINMSFSVEESAIISSSELSGNLPQSFRNLAERRTNRAKTKRFVLFALAYPVGLMHLAAVLLSLSYLVEGKADKFFVAVGVVLVPFWCVVTFVRLAFRQWPRASKEFSRFVPIVSSFRRNWDLGTLCNVLSGCLKSGMPVDQAWRAATKAANCDRLDALEVVVHQAIESGSLASQGMVATANLVPESFVQLYRSGEQTGRLEQNLEAAGKSFIEAAKGRLKAATIVYPSILLMAVFGYVGYRIIMIYKDYLNQLIELGS